MAFAAKLVPVTLLGVPASGFLIERLGWRAPWGLLSGLALLAAGLMHAALPAGRVAPLPGGLGPFISTLWGTWASLLQQRSIRILLAVAFLLTLSIELPLIVYGAWLESSFGLGLSTLGVASAAVGLAELAGEFGATVITDRLGKKRSVLLGLLGMATGLLLLPWLARLGLPAALAGIFWMMLSYEFAFVSYLPMFSEAAPQARAALLSLNVTAFSLSRVIGTPLGGWLWRWQSIGLQALVGAACALIAALVLWRGTSDDAR